MIRAARRLRLLVSSADDGMTLVELLIYVSFLGVIAVLAGAALAAGLGAQRTADGLAQATDEGQLISNSVQAGVRNASGPPNATDPEQAVGIKAEVSTAAGQLLRARVALGTSGANVTWQCEAWYYSTGTQSVYFARSVAGGINDPGGFYFTNADHTASAPVVAQSGISWTLLGGGVKVADGATQFFGASTDRVVLRFEVTRHDLSLVLIPNTIVRRTVGIAGTGPAQCF